MVSRISLFFPTVLLVSSISFFATDIYLPSFSAIQHDFETTRSSVKLSLSLYLAASALAQLFYGPFSDREGRRKSLLWCLSIGCIGTAICLFSPNVFFLILGRVIQGLGLGGTAVLFRAILRDSYSGDELAHYGSLIAVATAIFMAIAPAFGGYIQYFLGWRISFLFLLLYIGGLFFAVLRFISETNQHLNPLALQKKNLLTNYSHIFKNPLFLGYTLVSSLTLGGLSAYLTASPFLFLQGLHLTPIQYGRLAWIVGGAFGIGGLCNRFLIRKIGRHRALVTGIVTIFVSGFSMLLFGLLGFFNVFAIMFPMGIFTIGAAMSFSNSFAAAFQPFAKMAGSAGALYGCMQLLGGALASALMSAIQEKSQMPLAVVLLTVSVLSYIFQYWAFSHAKKYHPTES